MPEILVTLDSVSKGFFIPSSRRNTIREHAFGLFHRPDVERLQVLDRISFDVRRGETLGIMGRNGSGKSTLLKIVAGVYKADSGRIQRNAPITPVLELGLGWNHELDAVDNIYLLGSVLGLNLQDIRTRLDEMLAFAELERFASLQLKYYSSGMASRLAYAVAFHAVREVLLLDEIFAVGDAGFRAKCEARYRQLSAAGHTIIMVSHDPRVVQLFCTRAVLLDGARIAASGSGVEIAQQYLTVSMNPADARSS